MRSKPENFSIAKLIENLQDENQIVRIHAATVLGSRGAAAEPAVGALLELLENGDIHDRKLAILTLGEIGPAAFEAIPALFAVVDDANESLAEMAEEALAQIDGSSEAAEAA